MMTTEIEQDRRRFPRATVVRPCKIRDRRNLGLCAGETTDLSRGGSLVCVQRERNFKPGDEIEFGVTWDASPIIKSESMVKARVIRVLPIDHYQQALAIEFVEELAQFDAGSGRVSTMAA